MAVNFFEEAEKSIIKKSILTDCRINEHKNAKINKMLDFLYIEGNY